MILQFFTIFSLVMTHCKQQVRTHWYLYFCAYKPLVQIKRGFQLNCDKIQPININMSNIKAKNVDLNGIYRSPNGDMNMKQCEIHF